MSSPHLEEMDNFQHSESLSLERVLRDESADPTNLPFWYLKSITKDFSKIHELGRGGFGAVYKGVHANGEEIAIKKLYQMPELDESKQFQNEFENLMRLKHQNIVRLIGYCYETQRIHQNYDGKLVLAEDTFRALCFEYMHNGSLQKHISGENGGLDWPTRYKIIRGTCEGLKYLHEGLDYPIYHLDLKPDNILLDKDMVPKLADFGLSKLFGEEQTRVTQNFAGTYGYLPPEYIDRKLVSKKLDIFSLGVIIIKTVAGLEGYSRSCEMPSQQFVELVHDKWLGRLNGESSVASMEVYCRQIKRCIEVALTCVEDDRANRPYIGDVLQKLDEIGMGIIDEVALSCSEPGTSVDQISPAPELVDGVNLMTVSRASQLQVSALDSFNLCYRQAKKACKPQRISSHKGPGGSTSEISPGSAKIKSGQLDVHPLELRFPFEANKRINCTLSITNKTDHHVFFLVRPQVRDIYVPSNSFHGVLDPMSSTGVIVTMVEQQQPLLDTGMLEIVMVCIAREISLRNLIPYKASMDSDLLKRVEQLGGEVYEAMLTVVVCPPSQTMAPPMIISSHEFQYVSSTDVHPTEPWILLGHGSFYISIWNYQTKAIVMTSEVGTHFGVFHRMRHGRTRVGGVKFISRKEREWFVAGDSSGYIHVYSCLTMARIKSFKAHGGKQINALATHSIMAILLTGDKDGQIKMWDWEKGWYCYPRRFKGGRCLSQLKFDPKDTDKFASASSAGIKVWSVYSSNASIIIDKNHVSPSSGCDYLFTGSVHHVVIIPAKVQAARVLDLLTAKPVHTFGLNQMCLNQMCISAVACHPRHPLIATGSSAGRDSNQQTEYMVWLWNASNSYRLERAILCQLNSPIKGFAFVGSTRPDLDAAVAEYFPAIHAYETSSSTFRINWLETYT